MVQLSAREAAVVLAIERPGHGSGYFSGNPRPFNVTLYPVSVDNGAQRRAIGFICPVVDEAKDEGGPGAQARRHLHDLLQHSKQQIAYFL